MKVLYNSKRKYENWTAPVSCSKCNSILNVCIDDLEMSRNLFNEPVYRVICPICKCLIAVTNVPDCVRSELRDRQAQLNMFGMISE